MTAENWSPVTDARRLRESGCLIGTGRLYAAPGTLWPRLRVAIETADATEYGGVKVCCHRKNSPQDWWARCGVPAALVPDLIEMLREPVLT